MTDYDQNKFREKLLDIAKGITKVHRFGPFGGIHYDKSNKTACATDGKVLLRSELLYVPKLDGLIVSYWKMEIIDNIFPDTARILKPLSEYKYKKDILAQPLDGVRGKIGTRVGITEDGLFIIGAGIKGCIALIDLNYLRLIAPFAGKIQVSMYFQDDKTQITFEMPEIKTTLIVMPIAKTGL